MSKASFTSPAVPAERRESAPRLPLGRTGLELGRLPELYEPSSKLGPVHALSLSGRRQTTCTISGASYSGLFLLRVSSG